MVKKSLRRSQRVQDRELTPRSRAQPIRFMNEVGKKTRGRKGQKTKGGFVIKKKPPKVIVARAPKTTKTFENFMESQGSIKKDNRIEFDKLNITVNANEFFFLLAEDIRHDHKKLREKLKPLKNNKQKNKIVLRMLFRQFFPKKTQPPWMNTNEQISSIGDSAESRVKKTMNHVFKSSKSEKIKLETKEVINFDATIPAPLLTVYDSASQGGASTIMVGKQYLNYLVTPSNWMDGGFYLTPTSRGGDAVMYTTKPVEFNISTTNGEIIFDGVIKQINGKWGVKLTTLFGEELKDEPITIDVKGRDTATNYLSKFFGDFAQIIYCLSFDRKSRTNQPEPPLYLFWQTSDKIAQTIYLFMAKSYRKAPALIAEIGNDPRSGIPKSVDIYLPNDSERVKSFKNVLKAFNSATKPQVSFGNSRLNANTGGSVNSKQTKSGNTNYFSIQSRQNTINTNVTSGRKHRREEGNGESNRTVVRRVQYNRTIPGLLERSGESNSTTRFNKQLSNLLNAKYRSGTTLNQVRQNINRILSQKYS